MKQITDIDILNTLRSKLIARYGKEEIKGIMVPEVPKKLHRQFVELGTIGLFAVMCCGNFYLAITHGLFEAAFFTIPTISVGLAAIFQKTKTWGYTCCNLENGDFVSGWKNSYVESFHVIEKLEKGYTIKELFDEIERAYTKQKRKESDIQQKRVRILIDAALQPYTLTDNEKLLPMKIEQELKECGIWEDAT